MNLIFPVIPALVEAMPDIGLPIELWAIILRKLDPKSLLVAVKAYSHWLNIARGDPVLRRNIRKQMKMEERAKQQEEADAGLLMTITRSQSEASTLFRGNVNTKNVQRRARTVLTAPELSCDFNMKKKKGGLGPIRKKKSARPAPYKSMRC